MFPQGGDAMRLLSKSAPIAVFSAALALGCSDEGDPPSGGQGTAGAVATGGASQATEGQTEPTGGTPGSGGAPSVGSEGAGGTPGSGGAQLAGTGGVGGTGGTGGGETGGVGGTGGTGGGETGGVGGTAGTASGGASGAGAAACDDPPPLPITDFQVIEGVPGTEDFSFDNLGYVVGVSERAYRVTYDGELETVVPGIGRAQGTQVLLNGDYALVQSPEITRITTSGSVSTLYANTSSGNGIALDREGFLYVTDNEDIRRIDPDTGQDTVFARVPFDDSNGITFSPDYDILYVGNCGGHRSPYDGEIYKIPISEDGTPGEAEWFAEIPVDSHQNGITMDECGNLYVVLSTGFIYRLSPDAEWEMVVDLRTGGELNLAAINFGSGIGGWRTDSIYVSPYSGDGLYEVNVGVPGKFEPHLL